MAEALKEARGAYSKEPKEYKRKEKVWEQRIRLLKDKIQGLWKKK